MKPWWQSKSLWGAALQAVGAVLLAEPRYRLMGLCLLAVGEVIKTYGLRTAEKKLTGKKTP